MIPDLIDHIKKNKENIELNSSLINISNGALLPYIEKSLQEELNPRSYEISKNRIPPINIIQKLQLKLSKVYGEEPTRESSENDIDSELLDHYSLSWDLNTNLQYANELLVINKYCALEPYMVSGLPSLRVLSTKDFIVYSDSLIQPNEMTVFIKFSGSHMVMNERGDPEQKAIFTAYSEDEFVIFNENGTVLESDINPHGVIPFIYIRTNTNELIPTPDSDMFPMATLIPRLLTDLNYAILFGCRSQVVGIDVEVDNLEFSPDSMWLLSSVEGQDKSPSLSTIKSDVDVDKVLSLINEQLGMFLDSKGIKAGSIGKATIEGAVSGISKLIDESDATAVNRKYKKIFQNTERNLWKLLKDLHNTWVNNGESEEKRNLSSDFRPIVELKDSKIIPNNKEILEELKLKQELGLFTIRDGLKKLNPNLTEEELQQKIDEITSESEISLNFNEPDEE